MLDYKEELKRLCALTPTELWLEYPTRNKYAEKVMVEWEKVNEEPMKVHTMLINYLQIPVRKPWIVTHICKSILATLAKADGATPREHRSEEHDVLVVAEGVDVSNFGDPVAWQQNERVDRDITGTTDDILLATI